MTAGAGMYCPAAQSGHPHQEGRQTDGGCVYRSRKLDLVNLGEEIRASRRKMSADDRLLAPAREVVLELAARHRDVDVSRRLRSVSLPPMSAAPNRWPPRTLRIVLTKRATPGPELNGEAGKVPSPGRQTLSSSSYNAHPVAPARIQPAWTR